MSAPITEASAQVSDHRLDELIEEHTGYGADVPTGRVHSTFRMGELESVLREVRALRSALTASEQQVAKLQATFRHIHVANNTDGMLTDDCKQCGLDLRNPVHQRSV